MKISHVIALVGITAASFINPPNAAATPQDDKIVDSVCGMARLDGASCGLILRQHFDAIRNELHEPTRKDPDFNILVMTASGTAMGTFNGSLDECRNATKIHESFSVSMQCIPAHADTK